MSKAHEGEAQAAAKRRQGRPALRVIDGGQSAEAVEGKPATALFFHRDEVLAMINRVLVHGMPKGATEDARWDDVQKALEGLHASLSEYILAEPLFKYHAALIERGKWDDAQRPVADHLHDFLQVVRYAESLAAVGPIGSACDSGPE